MYNPGITTTVGNHAEAANSTIELTFVDSDIESGDAFCAMDVTLPWGTLDQFFGGYVGDVITRSGTYRFYAIKITAINVSAQSATFQVLSYARGSPANVGVSDHNLPLISDPGSSINYDFELTNLSSSNVNIRWLFASKIVTSSTDNSYPIANSSEALPTTSYKKLGCWYDDWAIGGACANGQTIIGNGGHTHITGNFTLTSDISKYENVALRIFVYVSNYWGTGKHEYVEVGGSSLLHQIFSNYSHLKCVNNVCTRISGTGTNTCSTIGSTTECTFTNATHYIEYDLSIMPSVILDYTNSTITTLSDDIIDYLPLSDNIIYDHSEYINSNKKFRIYVRYTPVLTLFDVINTLEQYAMAIAGILTFVLTYWYLKPFGVFGFVGSAGLGLGAAILSSSLIVELNKPSDPPIIVPAIPPSKEIDDVQVFADKERAKCDAMYPCVITKTCTKEQTQSYLLCIGLVDVMQNTHDDTIAGTFDNTKFENLLQQLNDLSTGLNNDTLTVEEVLGLLNGITDETIQNSNEKESLTTCEPGFVYDRNTQKCVQIEKCWIPLPFGGCLLSANTGKMILYAGAGLTVGYLAYKVFIKK